MPALISDFLNPATLSTVYWACLVTGGGLIVLSMLAGGHGSHADTGISAGAGIDTPSDYSADLPSDLHVEGPDLSVDAPHDALDTLHANHAGDVAPASTALSQWLSLRFLVYFAGVFGAVGVILTDFSPLPIGVVLSIAALSGMVVGQGVQQTMRMIQRTSGNSAPTAEEYVNRLARVTIPIEPPYRGEIAVQVRAAERRITAAAASGHLAGEQVVVVAYRGGIAEVVSREAYANRAQGGR